MQFFMKESGRAKRAATGVGLVIAGAVIAGGAVSAQAYNPTGSVVTQLGDEACLKGRGNCIIYPKSVQLPDGTLLMAFEKSTVVPESGSADGQTMPIWSSDDYGTTWTHLSDVPAPAYLSDDPAFAPYVSNWTNPNLYVLPQDIGDLSAGTLLLASVVSGDDHYFTEQKAANPNWVPSNDGDRSNVSIALFASEDGGTEWDVVDIIAEGGWQGGSAGNRGNAFASGNVQKQIDPLWEPHLDVHDDKLVVYYSDENDYLGFDPETGVAILDPDNDTAADSGGQVLVHKTWTGEGAWSEPVIDVAGLTENRGNGKTVIGGGRPGMTTIAPTTDGKWMMTFEYFGGGTVGRYKLADHPLEFFRDAGAGQGVDALPVTPGSSVLNRGGSPVTVALPDGRIAFNSDGSGEIWVNQSGRSDGEWTQYRTPLGSGYSRNIQYVEGTGRINLLQGVWGGASAGSEIRSADVDLGRSDGTYYRIVNSKTGQVIGTGGNTTDAHLGNNDRADVVLEAEGSAENPLTQQWHVITKADGNVTFLNGSGGREAAPWGGRVYDGQPLGQWRDDVANGRWVIEETERGTVRFRSVAEPNLYVTGANAGGSVTLSPASNDGAHEWTLVPVAPAAAELTERVQSAGLVAIDSAESGHTIELDASVERPAGAATHADVSGHVFAFSGDAAPIYVGTAEFDGNEKSSIALPADLPAGPTSIAVLFDETALVWDSLTVLAAEVEAEAPSAPAAPTARATGGSVELAWSAPDDGGSAITSYEVTIAPAAAGGDGVRAAAEGRTIIVTDGLAASMSLVVSDLAPGEYTAAVGAVNAVGSSTASPQSDAFTIAAVVGPTPEPSPEPSPEPTPAPSPNPSNPAGGTPAGGGASLAGTGFELPLGALGFALLALVGGAFLIRKRRADRA